VRLLERPTRGWLRDVRLWVGLAFLGYVLFGFLGIPAILRWQVPRLVRTYLERDASLRAASFNPFTFTGVLRGFELRDKDGSHLAGFDELKVNLQASGLFRRAWTFREILLVRPSAVGRILADGRIAVADLLEPKPGQDKPEEEFRLPRVLVQEFRVEAGKLAFRDETVTPAFETSLEPLSLQASDLSTIPERSGDHVVTVGLENGQVRWSGRMSMEPIRFEGQLEVSLTEFRRVAEYVAREYPVRMASGAVHLVLPYVVEKVAGGTLRAELHDIAFDVAALDFRPRDSRDAWLRLGLVELKGGRVRWPDKSVEVDLLRISEPAVQAWRSEDGTLNWLSFVERLRASFASSEPASGSGTAWKASCAAFEIAGGAVDVEDRTLAPPQKLALSGIESRLENLTSDGSAPVRVRLSAKVNESGTVSAAGTLAMSPPAADLDVEATGLELAAFQGYASQVARVQLRSGSVGVRGKASYRQGGKPLARFEGRATLDRLLLADPDGVPVLSWDGLAVEDIRLALEPNLARVRTLNLTNPFAQILIDRQGQIGALKLFEAEPTGDAPAVAAPPPPAAAPAASAAAPFPFPFEIGSIRIHGGKVDYADESLILPFATKIHSAEGSVSDLSSKGSAGSHLLVEGKVDEYGYAKAEGTLRVFDPYAASDIRVLFRNVDMSRLTPYTAEFAGYSIKEGRLDLEVGYEIRDRALVGNHKLTATQLTLGDKVEGAKASLPLRLAVALLKDSQGRIELDVPIEGSVDDPEFAYRKVIWGAFKRILVNVTTAPFRFLGRLMGIEGDDLEYVSFEAGRSTLLPPEKEKLAKLVEGMKSRPGIALEIGGRFDPVSDADALRRDRLDALIAARRETMAPGAAEEGEAVLDRVLEALYAEAFSAEARETLRHKHTSAPPAGAAAPVEGAAKRGRKEPPPPEPVFDAAGYFEEIRGALLQAQSASPDDLAALARARGEAIMAALTGEGGIEAARVTASEVEPIKKKKAGQDLVPCQLAMPAD